jgi:hypothetical protein
VSSEQEGHAASGIATFAVFFLHKNVLDHSMQGYAVVFFCWSPIDLHRDLFSHIRYNSDYINLHVYEIVNHKSVGMWKESRNLF